MRKYVNLLLLIFVLSSFSLPVYSAEKEKASSEWGTNSSVFNSGFEGQKQVSDSAFKKAVNIIKEHSMSSKQKKLQKQVKPLSPLSDSEHLKNFTDDQTYDDGSINSHTVMIPMPACTADGTYIQPGYYKLSCRQLSKDEYVLDLSQGTTKLLSVSAKQTKQDLEQETLSFGRAQVIDNNRIRLIYGTIDLNLVGYLYFK